MLPPPTVPPPPIIFFFPLPWPLAGKQPHSSTAAVATTTRLIPTSTIPFMATSSSLLPLLFFFLLFHSSSPESAEDRAALLDFISNVPHEGRIQWNSSTSSCSWVGVQCDANQSRVVSLRLPGVGLVGPIPPSTVGRLTALRVLSLRSNRLTGPLPSDLSNLPLLRSLYLQNNVLAGGFPPALPLLTRLTRVDISGNLFSGEIPFAVNNLTRLTRLFLQSNNFSGHLPSISIPSMEDFSVADNRLNGSIPASLARYPSASFAGNVELCGPPLSTPCSPFFTAPSPAPSSPPTVPVQNSHRRRRLSRGAIIAIAVISAAVILALLLLLLFCLRRRRSAADSTAKAAPARTIGAGSSAAAETGTSSSKDEAGGGVGGGEGGAGNKLVFVEGGGYSFDLEDLLRASAEVLGKGSAGTSYKAVLEEGTTVVVKRLKDVAAGRREFEQQMEALGKVKQPNVVPLRAYYYSKDEKLLVSDFMAAGSLSALLHGSRGSGRTPLDWDNRMRIALAAGRGIAHIHAAAGIPHGNIKASNVLLRPDLDAAVSDFGLAALFSPHAPAHRGAAGYRAPEVVETRKPTFKSDVYSYGVLLLELLTGKSPAAAAVGGGAGAGEGEGIDLPRWVQSVVREEWTAEVFDVELMRYQDIEEEMVQLLQVAMACVATSPDQRPDFAEVLRTVEEMVRSDAEDAGRRPSSSSEKAAGGGSASHTPPAAPTP